jgi:hypothetical protein
MKRISPRCGARAERKAFLPSLPPPPPLSFFAELILCGHAAYPQAFLDLKVLQLLIKVLRGRSIQLKAIPRKKARNGRSISLTLSFQRGVQRFC